MLIGTRNHDYGKKSIEELPKFVKKNGFDSVQLVLPKAYFEINSYEEVTVEILEKIKKTFINEKVKISVLGCYMDLANPDKGVRTKGVDIFKIMLKYGKVLDAQCVGTETAYPILSESEKKVWEPFMLDSLEKIILEAEKVEQKIGLEPVHWHPLDEVEKTKKIFDKFNSKYLNMIFDPVNLLKYKPNIEYKKYLEKWMNELGDKVNVIHTKNFIRGKNGEYIPTSLEEGVIDYTWILNWFKKNNPNISIIREEIKPENTEKDILYIKKIWKY